MFSGTTKNLLRLISSIEFLRYYNDYSFKAVAQKLAIIICHYSEFCLKHNNQDKYRNLLNILREHASVDDLMSEFQKLFKLPDSNQKVEQFYQDIRTK